MPSYCTVPQAPVRPVPDSASPNRLRAIRTLEQKWVNGTVIRFHLVLPNGVPARFPDQFKDATRRGFSAWTDLNIGLTFIEVDDIQDAEVRIGFDPGEVGDPESGGLCEPQGCVCKLTAKCMAHMTQLQSTTWIQSAFRVA